MDSDEDDEEPQNEPGTSSNYQPTVPVLPLHQRPAVSSQGPAAPDNSVDEDTEYVLTDDEHWSKTPETQKYAAAAGSFCFVTTENGDQQDICKSITMPCVQWSLYLNDSGTQVEVTKRVDGQTRDMLERCMVTYGRAAGTRAKIRSGARKEALAQEVR